MPEPIAPEDNNLEDDPTPNPTPSAPPTLDQVHAISQAKLNDEDEDAKDVPADKTDDTPPADDQQPGAGDGDDEEVATPPEPEAEAPVVTPEPVTPPTPATPDKPVVDTDITKPGEGKVAIKDVDGKTFYFNSLDEVPDSFEPVSYKELMRGVDELGEKRRADAKTAADNQEKADKEAADAELTQRSQDMQKSWDEDTTELVRAGTLPNEPAKLEAAKEEVYAYMESELKKGNAITSFKTAYKNMMYDKEQVAKTAKQKEVDDAKKKRGAMVQPGSGGGNDGKPATGSTQGRVLEAPPSGAGLDAVHAHAVSQL
jgi:hypothetical protein